MNFTPNQKIFSLSIIRLVGYGLLMMASIDLLVTIIPLKLMNYNWEFQTIGTIIERIPLTLIGIGLVFYGERSDRTPIETLVLRWLSRLTLILAIMLVLTIPLNIVNGFRIYHNYNANINAKTIPRIDAMEDFKGKLQATNSLEQIESILETKSNKDIVLPDSWDSEELKANIIQKLQNNQDLLRSQVQSSNEQKSSFLLKKAVKWNLAALISSFIFFFIWKQTLWARLEVSRDLKYE